MMMDSMEILEEERRIRADLELKNLEEAIFGRRGDETILSFQERDLLGKGRTVTPSGKQWKIVNTMAGQIRVNISVIEGIRKSRIFSAGMNSIDSSEESLSELGLKDFDITSKPRIFINGGYVTKTEKDYSLSLGSMKKTHNRKYLLLFSDVLLITLKKDPNVEMFDLQAVIWVQDMRLQRIEIDTSTSKSGTSSSASTVDDGISSAQLGFEIISVKTRSRLQLNYTFVCDNETQYDNWIEDIENVLLAYHIETPIIKQIGWYNEIILGSLHSAAYTGDLNLLRKHLKLMEKNSISIDIKDMSGMTALHWAIFRDHEVCVRLLLDQGADPDLRQAGENTGLLLAAARGNDTICRLLLERGADINARNAQDRGAIFMVVVFGYISKGLPWLLQLFNSQGLDLNQMDRKGYSPLHLCAEMNIVRPIRMLVDAGADVNAKHGKSSLTALQMACLNASPDVETIRSFLDKGAYPNWRDLQGKTALDIILKSSLTPQNKSNLSYQDVENSPKWRPMDDTLERVGHWTVKILPIILELVKKGGRFNPKNIECLRPSFKAAIIEALQFWEKRIEPVNFSEYVASQHQSGIRMILHRDSWTSDQASPNCQLCNNREGKFGLQNRRHHCRACGSLVCGSCSSKRLNLEGNSLLPNSVKSPSSSGSTPGTMLQGDRVCDGCFNRLCHEATQPSPEHHRVRNLRQCAMDLMQSINALVEVLDESDDSLDPISRQTAVLTRTLEDFVSNTNSGKLQSPSRKLSRTIQGYSTANESLLGENKSDDLAFIDIIRRREDKLLICEDIAKKFVEVSEGYRRSSKHIIDRRLANSRLWGTS